MVDSLRRFFDNLGLMQRLQQEQQSLPHGTLFGHNVGDTPLIGGLLRPYTGAMQGGGLTLEALNAVGQAIAGEAAVPAVLAQARFGSQDSPLTQYAQTMAAPGAGNLALHPRQTIEQLRHSPDKATSYLAGILNMASDPTNVLLAPIGGLMEAGRAAEAAARAGAGATASRDFLEATAKELAAQGTKEGNLATRVNDVFQGQQKVRDLADQLATAKQNTANKQFDLQEFKDYYKQARGAVADELKAARARGEFQPVKPFTTDSQTGLPVFNPETDVIKAANEQRRVNIVNDVLSRYPGGPTQGMDYHTFLREPKQALYQAMNEEQSITKLYNEAVKTAPQPIKYSISGQALGKDKGLVPDKQHINEVFNAQEGIGVAPAGAPDSPAAIQQAVDDVGAAAKTPPPMGDRNIVPADTRGFTTRMADLLSYAFQQGLAEQKAAMARPGVMVNFGQLASIWKGQAIQTLRNVFMDEIYSRAVAWDAGIRQAAFTQSKDAIIQRMTTAEKNGNPLMLLGDVSDVLEKVGLGGTLKPKQVKAISDNIGISPLDAETENIKQLSAMQQLAGNAALGLANPVRGSVGLLAMPLGYLAPMRQRAFHILNSVTHMAAKGEAFEQGFLPYLENSANELFRLAESEGKDVSALRGFGMVDTLGSTADGMLLHEGAFSPTAVQMVLGDRFAAEWTRMLDGALQAGYQRANAVFGNYARRGALEQNINKFVPFMSWAWRAYPRMAKMVLAHPAVGAAVLQLHEAELQQAKEQHLPGYLATTVGISKDTPLVGVLARVFSPEQEAAVRINPISLFSPVPSEGLAALTSTSDTGGGEDTRSLYQKVRDTAGIVGLGANPVIQATAYATGQDYQTPTPLSRYANIDQMWNDLGIPSPYAPSIAYGPLHALRQAVTGKPDTYDPVLAKAKELVFEDTGYPLSDPRNRFIAADIANGDSDYLKRAEKIVDVGGAARTAFNATSPESISVRTQTATQKAQAGQPPFDYQDIQDMQAVSPMLAQMMQQAVDIWYQQHPAAAVGKSAKVTAGDKAIAAGARKRALRQAMGIANP